MINLYRTICGYRNGNAGDLCTEKIIERLFGLEVNAKEDDEALKQDDINLIGAGSIAAKIPYKYSGKIWGVGAMYENDRPDTPQAEVLAVRGKLTKHRWVGHKTKNSVLGDIGLLVNNIFDASSIIKKYKLGIIPHYIDADNLGLRNFLEKNKECLCIDICDKLDNVLRAICECDVILSSSLHGLVFSDSLNIKNHWMILSNKISGGSFKFHDYYSTFNMYDTLPCLFNEYMSINDLIWYTSNYDRPGIEQIKQNLINVFPFKSGD